MGKKRITVIDLASEEKAVTKSAKTKISRVYETRAKSASKSQKKAFAESTEATEITEKKTEKAVTEGAERTEGTEKKAVTEGAELAEGTEKPFDSAQDKLKRAKKKPEKPKKIVEKKGRAVLKSGKGGDGRLSDMGTMALEEMDRIKKAEEEAEEISQQVAKGKAKKPAQVKVRSKRYQQLLKLIDRTKLYPLKEAVILVKKTSVSRFNGSVEVHINVKEAGQSGFVSLPHGTGQTKIIAIADDKLLAKLEKGVIDFDVLVAPPEMMSKIAKYARLLGPRGLMPNPKNGTITDKPKEKAKELEGGKTYFKTESKIPIIHQIIGKVDYKEEQLLENLKSLLIAVKPSLIRSAVIAATMGPGIKLDISEIK